MAKYCDKCGKALPEDVEKCPDCSAQTQNGESAALFTMMTAETEIWKDSGAEERKNEKREQLRKNKKKILIAASSIVLAAVVIFLILFFRPGAVVARTLGRGEYERARSLYTEKFQASEPTGQVEKALKKAAESVRDSFAAHETEEAEAKSAIGSLCAFGSFTDALLADVIEDMEQLYISRSSMSEGELLLQRGDYLAASVRFRAVSELDSMYDEAQKKMQQCFDEYSQEILSQAGGFIIEDDYASAIRILREGDAKLQELDTFSESIDAKLQECFGLYSDRILTEAMELAEAEDYAGAAEIIRECVEDFGYSNEELLGALEDYRQKAEDKIADDALYNATELYGKMHYADAFAALDEALDALPDGDNRDKVKQSIDDMEQLFVSDMLAAADEIYGGNRDKLPDAIAKMERAYAIRPLAPIKEKGEELEKYLPFKLALRDYIAKEGEIFRDSSSFQALSKDKFDNWIWGRNESSISFELNGEYDIFEASFAIRRESTKAMSGYFEIWCDGEKVYTSDTLSHKSDSFVIPISVDISGVDELKLVFFCDYEASSAENGYSYHGLCQAQALKAQ